LKKYLLRDLAEQRFWNLYNFALRELEKGNTNNASKAMRRAFKIAKKGGYNVPQHVKRNVCRRCYIPLVPGKSLRVRIRSKGRPTIVRTCLNCGFVRRIPVSESERVKGDVVPNEAYGSHREERRYRGRAK